MAGGGGVGARKSRKNCWEGVGDVFFSNLSHNFEFFRIFLEVESATLWARCRAIIDRTIMCKCRRDLLMVSVIMSEQQFNNSEIPTITYQLNSHISVGGRPPARIFRQGAH